MVMTLAIFLLGTIAGLAISLIAMESVMAKFLENMQFIEIDKDE